MWTQQTDNSSDNPHCFCWGLDPASVGSILQNDKRSLKTRRRSRQFPRGEKTIFWVRVIVLYCLIMIDYGFLYGWNMCSQKPVFFPLGINKGLVRLNLAENMVGCDFLGADPKILIQNDYKTRFLMEVSCFCSFFFDNFAWICTILAIQNQLFSNEKHTTMFQISAKGWFLWFFKSSKASGVSIKGFD